MTLLATELFFVLASVLLAGNALTGSLRAWRVQSHPIDYAMRILACTWMVYLLVTAWQTLAASQLAILASLPIFVIDLALNCLLSSLAFFLLTAAGAVRPWLLAVLVVQFLSGLLAAAAVSTSVAALPEFRLSLLALKLVSAACVTAAVLRQVRFTHSRRSWLVLAACAMGIGLWLYQSASGNTAQGALPVVYHLYAFFVFVVYKLISLNTDADKVLAHAGTSFSGLSSFQTMNSVNSDEQFISLALRGERQRISYELHDHIGSQIVSILFAMQAAEQPQKRFVMLSLEQCLSDLKMVVDALDSFEENVTQSLGRLRYRVQHALDRQGITMHWDVDVSAELEAVKGIYAQQVLRIAQECMANVMRHAQASAVKVTCRFKPEFGHLVLEVWDNGIGFTLEKTSDRASDQAGRVAGCGLENMKRRAAAVGGHLHIASRRGAGACVRLTLPLPQLKLPQKQLVFPETNSPAAA